MPLDEADELRLVAVETAVAALQDLIGNRLDFSDRKYFNEKIIEHTPVEEE